MTAASWHPTTTRNTHRGNFVTYGSSSSNMAMNHHHHQQSHHKETTTTVSSKVCRRMILWFIALVLVILQVMVADIIYLHPSEYNQRMMEEQNYLYNTPTVHLDDATDDPITTKTTTTNQQHMQKQQQQQQEQQRRRAEIIVSNRNRQGKRTDSINVSNDIDNANSAVAPDKSLNAKDINNFNANYILRVQKNNDNFVDQVPTRNNKNAVAEIVDPILDQILKAGKFYSICRGDRSGSVIADMIYAHAFAYEHNITYVGNCCVTKGLPKEDTKHLIHTLHWHTVIPFACPKGIDNIKYNLRKPNATSIHPLLLNPEVYRLQGERSNFKPAWRQSIQQALYQYSDHRPKRPYHIAVHVRRGDVTPCTYKRRYLPNSHYLTLIDQYTPNATVLNGRPLQVTIYSESDTFEPFDAFIERNYKLEIDTADLAHVWKALSTADVAILSRSYFSIVPTSINPNIVVATEFFEFDVRQMDGWDHADPLVVKTSDEIIQQMFRNQCNGTKQYVGSSNKSNKNFVNAHVATA